MSDLLCELWKQNHVKIFLEAPRWCDMEWTEQVIAVLPRRIILRGVCRAANGEVPCDYLVMMMMNSMTKLDDLKHSVGQSTNQRNALQKVFYIMGRTIGENHLEAFPADVVPQNDNDRPREPVPDADMERVAAHLHSTMGHPANAALARAVRLTSGSECAICACLRHQRSVCRRLRVPGPPPAGSLSPERDFGDTVRVDLFELAGTSGRRQFFLNVVDLASRF